MTKVTKDNSGDAPNASSSQPAAVPGNPGVDAQGGARPAHGNRPEPMHHAADEERVLKASDVKTKEDTVDEAGVRIDPITGIAVAQIEASQSDYNADQGGSGGMRSIPIQAFDSRKLKGHEHVTVRGNTVIVADPNYDESKDKKNKEGEAHLSKSVQEERKAGRDAVSSNKKSAEADKRD